MKKVKLMIEPLINKMTLYLSPVIIFIGGFIFFPLFGFGLLSVLHIEQNPLGGIFVVLGVIFGRIIADQTRYLCFGLLVIFLILATALFFRKPWSRLQWSLFSLILLSIICTPFLYQYQPPVTAAPGRQIIVATHRSAMDGFIGRVQEIIEITPAQLQILGWTTDNKLVYEANQGQTFIFDPISNDNPRALESTMPDIIPHQLRIDIRDALWAQDGKTTSVSGIAQEAGMRSPDGQWAAIVASHAFGPEDVVLVRLQ